MKFLLFILIICSIIIGLISSLYGQKRNLIVSGVCAIILGFSIGLIKGLTIFNRLIGFLLSIIIGFVFIFSGLSTRNAKEKSKDVFRKYFIKSRKL